MKYAVLECMRCDHRLVIKNDTMEKGEVYRLGHRVCRNDHPPHDRWAVVDVLDEYSSPLYSSYHGGDWDWDSGCPACNGCPVELSS